MKKIIFYMILISILNIFDAMITYYSINFVRAEEINPLMNFLIEQGWTWFFIFKLGICDLFLAGFLIYLWKHPPVFRDIRRICGIFLTLSIIYFCVVCFNVLQFVLVWFELI